MPGGRAERGSASAFIKDLSDRLANCVRLTIDGHKPYLEAVEGAFGSEIDYAQLIKFYGPSDSESQRRYRPASPIVSGRLTRS